MYHCKLKRIISILIIMILLILTGCSSEENIKNNYIYKGENEFWTSNYNLNYIGKPTEVYGNTYYESYESTLTLTYKKDLSELSSVKNLIIYYYFNVGGGGLNIENSKIQPLKKTYTIKGESSSSGSGSGGVIGNPDKTIIVNIDIDGKIQKIELKNIQ